MKSYLFIFILHLNVFDLSAQSRKIDSFTIPTLSPKPTLVAGVQQPLISLNGEWNFQITGSTKQDKIKVPGEWAMQGFTVNEGETAIYTRELKIPDDWKDKTIKLRFDGVSSYALIKVNGKTVGEHEGSFVPFEVGITSALNNNKNILQVEVQAQTISDKLACTSQYAAHIVGGILRNAIMFALPETNISNIIVNTTFDKQFKNATLKINTTIAKTSNTESSTFFRYTLRDANGKIILHKASKEKITNIAVKHPQQWDPEHPYLYELITELLQKGKPIETIKQKIGFRQVEVRGNILSVNGRPVKLHGVCRHSIYPLTGRSVSDSLDIKDAVLFREGNCNYIRTSHYPPSEAFLNACDSLGLFVESESSLCWMQRGASPIWKLWNYEDEKFLPYMINANVEKMVAEHNHPSIIIWSLGNESRWSPLWVKINKVVKELDPSRPTTFHDQCWGISNNEGSKADIAVYHYPGINGSAACDTMKRPVLFGEYAHVSCYSRREIATDPGVREDYGAPLVQMYDSMYHHKACLGGAIWSGIDDIFDMPDGRIIGYGPWGVIDAWRRPKPEYYGMKKAYSPVVITRIEYPFSNKKMLRLFLENRYDFTNLNSTKIKYTINGIDKTIITNIPAHDSGVIDIPVEADTKDVLITFIDPRGFVADEEKIILQKEKPVKSENVPISFTQNEASITVHQGDVNYLISKHTGIILSIKKQGKLIVSQGPVFGIAPMNDDDGGKLNVAGNTYQNNIYPLKNYVLYTSFVKNFSLQSLNDSIYISMNVFYSDGSTSKQSYSFLTNRTTTITYEVKYHGKDTLPRQYGMTIQLPKTLDRLSWKRKGAFSIYPANDIGRTEGFAMMNAKQVASVEEWGVVPKNDWKDDANDLGSNDFRSTKRNIYNAVLSDEENNGVEIISDGTQATRSWLQDEKIQLLVADYNNNGSEPFYTSPFTNGRINIKNKILKGKLVFKIQ
ncbi:MAG: glycoside hydrolase family 2 TIM barrel-domain containing protein [Ginsengibacter sp.]